MTQRQQVAQIQGQPIYAVTNVAIIPTSSQADATRAISQARKELSQNDPTFDSGSDEDEFPNTATEAAETEVGTSPSSPDHEISHTRGISVGSIAEDVIGKKLRFGRFAANWLSRKNLGLPRPGSLEQEQEISESPFVDDSPRLSTDEPEVKDQVTKAAVPKDVDQGKQVDKFKTVQATELLPKLLRYTRLLFGSHNFFFAYDYDLTRSFNAQQSRNEHLPMHKMVDPLVCGP